MSDEKPAASQFDSWHALIQKLPAPADDRWRAIAIWNAALEAAVDNLGVDKNAFVTEGKYYEAAIIRDVQTRIKTLKASASTRLTGL